VAILGTVGRRDDFDFSGECGWGIIRRRVVDSRPHVSHESNVSEVLVMFLRCLVGEPMDHTTCAIRLNRTISWSAAIKVLAAIIEIASSFPCVLP
jgi:hypothetical protein